MGSKPRAPGAKGFTLIEVMVALAVVALALPALIMTLYQQVDGTAYLRDKSVAQIVATNQFTALRMKSVSLVPLRPGTDSGMEEMLERQWHWWLEITTTEVEQFYRIEINVATSEEEEAQPIYTLVAFMQGAVEEEGEGSG